MNRAKVINISNFKGGTGKSTTTVAVSHELAKMGHRCLVVDFDPQGDATSLLLPTFDFDESTTIYQAIEANDLTIARYHVRENLDLIAADIDLVGLMLLLNKTKDLQKRASVLKNMLEPLLPEYDYVFIDVPPTLADNTNNAFVACDYVVICLQTQGAALRAARKLIPELKRIFDYYNPSLNLLGVLPVILSKGSATDLRIQEKAYEEFKDWMFDSVILHRERIKVWGETGIKDDPNDRWDQDALNQYRVFALELLQRMDEEVKV